MITYEVRDEVCHARVCADLTIYTAAQCRELLGDCLALGHPLVLDLAAVGEIDSAGVQLLIQAKRSGERRARPVQLVGHSRAVQEIIDLFQLAGQFGDPMIISSSDRQEHAR